MKIHLFSFFHTYEYDCWFFELLKTITISEITKASAYYKQHWAEIITVDEYIKRLFYVSDFLNRAAMPFLALVDCIFVFH